MDDDKKSLENIMNKIKSSKQAYEKSVLSEDDMTFEWTAVSKNERTVSQRLDESIIEFSGKKLADGQFAKENMENANFSCSDMHGANLAGANLRGVDFSGANLEDADLSGADLTGAVLAGAKLKNANFTGANLSGIKFEDVDIEGAILLDIKIDELMLEDLQALIEYLAKYYPHKLNLALINLALLDLSKIDLKNVSLRGVDFTGCNMTGVNIMELDLSDCIITPEQIAQALGRVPDALELKRILAPKKKAQKKGWNLDMEDFFNNRKEFGVIDTTRHKGTSIAQMMKMGQKLMKKLGYGEKPEPTGEEIMDQIREEKSAKEKDHNAELREIIEARKREALAKREEAKRMEIEQRLSGVEKKQEQEIVKEPEQKIEKSKVQNHDLDLGMVKGAIGHSRS